jgi:hypothetical protein
MRRRCWRVQSQRLQRSRCLAGFTPRYLGREGHPQHGGALLVVNATFEFVGRQFPELGGDLGGPFGSPAGAGGCGGGGAVGAAGPFLRGGDARD